MNKIIIKLKAYKQKGVEYVDLLMGKLPEIRPGVFIKLLMAVYMPLFLLPTAASILVLPTGDADDAVYFEISEGQSLYKTAGGLQEENLIRSAKIFTGITRMLGYDRAIKAGYYRLNRGMNMLEVMRKLRDGSSVLVQFTVAEGRNIFEIAAMLDGRGLVKKDDFLKAAHNSELLDEYGIPGKSFEGYLFPSTYYIARGHSANAYVRMMADQITKNAAKGDKPASWKY